MCKKYSVEQFITCLGAKWATDKIVETIGGFVMIYFGLHSYFVCLEKCYSDSGTRKMSNTIIRVTNAEYSDRYVDKFYAYLLTVQ